MKEVEIVALGLVVLYVLTRQQQPQKPPAPEFTPDSPLDQVVDWFGDLLASAPAAMFGDDTTLYTELEDGSMVPIS